MKRKSSGRGSWLILGCVSRHMMVHLIDACVIHAASDGDNGKGADVDATTKMVGRAGPDRDQGAHYADRLCCRD